MRTLSQFVRVAVFAAVATGGAVFLALNGWPQPDHVREFAGLVFVAIVLATAAAADADDRGTMTPSFVADLCALILFGGNAALGLAGVGIVARAVAFPDRLIPLRRTVVSAAGILIATEAAWLAYSAIGGVVDASAWPLQAAPIAAAVAVYAFVKIAVAEAIAPVVNDEPFNRSWMAAVPRNTPTYFVGAGVAAGLVEIVNRGAWELLPAAAIPLVCAERAYAASRARVAADDRRRRVIDSLQQGMAVLDAAGCVTLWNDALERLVDCPRQRALGRTVASAVPALAQTPLPRAIDEARTNRRAQSLAPLALSSPTRTRVLDVTILPAADGAMVLWLDITERAQAEQLLKRAEERLTLAAEGAHDGLWEWD